MTTGTPFVAIERRGAVGILVLANPDKRNALNKTLLQELRDGLLTLAAEAIGAVIITSRGSIFSAGYDVAALPEGFDEDWLRDLGGLAEAMRLLSEGPLPTVAALPGAAIGAGCELALSCDLRVAHPGVTLCMPPVRLGVVYTPEGVSRLISMCGAARARRLLLTAQSVDAATAERWGLLDVLVEESQLLDTAISVAEQLAAQPRAAMLGTRVLFERLLREGPSLSAASKEELLKLRHQAWLSPAAQALRERFRR